MGNPYCRNPQRIVLVGRVVFPMSTLNKEIVFFLILVGIMEVGNNRVEEIQQMSNTRDPEALIPEKNQKANQDAPKIGRELGQAHIEML